MANELKFGNKVVFLGGTPVTLPVAASDPGSAIAGDLYYNSVSNMVKYYNGTSWLNVGSSGTVTSVALSDGDGTSIFDFSGSPVTSSGTISISLHNQAANKVLSGPVSGVAAQPTYRSLVAADIPDLYATKALDNLASTAINTDLMPDIDLVHILGNNSKAWLAGNIRRLMAANGSTSIDTYVRELSDGVTGAQLSWTSSGVGFPQLTASCVPYLDAGKFLVVSAVTPTELGYLSGVTSAIQTQLNAKAADNIVIKKDGSVTYTASQPMGGFKLTGLAAGTGAGDSVRYEQAILASGVNAFAANQSFGGFKATNLADPASGQDAVTLAYLQARLAGLKPKQAVRAATTVAGVLITDFANASVIDGVTLATGDRILIKNQALAANNGIYTVNASGAPTRATDFDSLSPIDEINGAWVSVQEGTANAGIVWTQYGLVSTLDTDAINFEYFNPIASLIGGDMITFTGSVFTVDLATVSGLESTNAGNVAGQLRIKLEASNPSLKFTGSNELAAKLDAAGAIASGASGLAVQVDASTIEINTNALRLKAGGITNTHINASAAIALTKLAAVTANKALASDISGFIVASATSDTELGYLSGVTSAIQTQLNGKASTALDNLASVAINTSLLAASDNSIDLGSDAKEWKDAWAFNLKHNSSGTPNMGIMTTGNNGSIVMTAHGTGNLDILATKLRRAENGAASQYMEDQYFDGITLAANTSSPAEASSSLSFAVASFDGAVINYRIKEATSNKTRIGQFIVSSDGTIASSSDQFSETAVLGSASGLSLSADIFGGNVRILYNNTHASNAATLRAQIRRFRA